MTLSSHINHAPGEKKLLQHLLDHFIRAGQISEQGNPEGGEWGCTPPSTVRHQLDGVKNRMAYYGFGVPYNCLTVLDDGDRAGGYKHSYNAASDLFDSIVKFNHMVKSHAPTVLRDYGLN